MALLVKLGCRVLVLVPSASLIPGRPTLSEIVI